MASRPDPKTDELLGISLCAGMAGLDLGLHIAEPKYRTVCFVERNSFSASALVARMADASLAHAPIWDDLKTFDGTAWRGRVHILTAGYPCQPFTLSGNRKGAADPRHLWPDVARITSEIAPEWVFFENVPGHLSLGFHDVARDLQGMGYRIAARVVSAAEVGGSHTRERLFILGHSNVQKRGQQSSAPSKPAGNIVLQRSQSDGFTDGASTAGSELDAILGDVERNGLDKERVPIFPPTPSNLAQWRETLDRCPELKPCLHRLDDGLAYGMDRTSSAGNGVVPLAAAHAYCTLRAELRL